MQNHFCAVFLKIGACCALLNALVGCESLSHYPAGGSPDRAFITYWPDAGKRGGLRLAVKDLIDMKGEVTTAGSEYFAKSAPPAKRDAACLAIARERNVAIVGKANTTELAIGVSGINRYFGTPKNPLTRRRNLIPGGSSCGPAVAVASGMADVAFGTDTGGSIRVPAACCGVLGLKTTFGLIPLDGVYPIAPTRLDTIGPLAKDMPRLVQGMDLLQRGFADRYRAAVAARPAAGRIKVGRLRVPGADPKIELAIDEALAAAGFQVVELGNDFKKAWVQAEKDGNTVSASSAWLSDAKFRSQPGIRTRTKAVVALGQFEYTVNYRDALRRIPAWRVTLSQMLRRVDFIALPTIKQLPPTLPLFGGTALFEAKVLTMQNTVAVNLAGNPALALPIPVADRRVPVTSLQLIGPRLGEAQLLNAARLVVTGLATPGPHGLAAARRR